MFAPTNVYYVNPTTGNNANSGLSPTLAKASLLSAVTAAEATGSPAHIYVAPGQYDRLTGLSFDTDVTIDLAIIGTGAKPSDVTLGHYFESTGWSTNATYPHVYQRTRSSVGRVVDLAQRDELTGSPLHLSLETSLAAVAGKMDSYYIDGSNNVYVHSRHGSPTNDKILLCVNNLPVLLAGSSNAKVYLENVEFIGSVRYATGGTIYARSCDFYHAHQSNEKNALAIVDASEAGLWGCRAADTLADGFNYHESVGTTTFFEVDCLAARCGSDGGFNQCSTAHESVKGVRINGEYLDGEDSSISDVNTAQTVNLGCKVRSVGNAGFTVGAGATCYFEGVEIGGSAAFTEYLRVQSGATAYYRDMLRGYLTGPIAGTLTEGWP